MGAESLVIWGMLMAGACIGARSGGRLYGTTVSLLCTALWAVIAAVGLCAGFDAVVAGLSAAGGLAIILGGLCSGATGQLPLQTNSRPPAVADTGRAPPAPTAAVQVPCLLSELPRRFGEWLDQYRQHSDPWPAFECHIQTVLRQVCGARETRAYRVLERGGLALPLGHLTPQNMADCLALQDGVVGWVVQSGKPFHQSAMVDDVDLRQRIARTQPAVRWAFPIVRGQDVVGVVTVGALSSDAAGDVNLLKLTAGLITEQWTCVAEICRARVATVTDPATGLATRAQLLQQAPLLLNQARRLARPLTAAAFSIEGLRHLDDEGLWGLRDQAVASVAKLLRRHVRAEDYAGRFDDSRFVLLWQGADGDQARSTASKIVSELRQLFDDRQRWPHRLQVRCGTASTRQHADNLRSLLSTAILNSLKPNGDGLRAAEPASAGLAACREHHA